MNIQLRLQHESDMSHKWATRLECASACAAEPAAAAPTLSPASAAAPPPPPPDPCPARSRFPPSDPYLRCGGTAYDRVDFRTSRGGTTCAENLCNDATEMTSIPFVKL